MYQDILVTLRTIESATKGVLDNHRDMSDKDLGLDCTVLNAMGSQSLRLLEQSIEKLDSLLGDDEDAYKELFDIADPSMEISSPSDLHDKLEEVRESLSDILTDYIVELDTAEEVRGLRKDNLLVEDRLIQDLEDFKGDGEVQVLIKFLS